MDSASVTSGQVNSTDMAQGIVNAYNAILNSADGRVGNTTTQPTVAQYNLIGIAAAGGVAIDGNTLHLLDDVVDSSLTAAVDTETELQAMADAAAHVMASAGGSTVVNRNDLKALGIEGVTDADLTAVQNAIKAVASDSNLDTQHKLQTVVNNALHETGTALNVISDAADKNSATSGNLLATTYATAGVTGAQAHLSAINSALDSSYVTGAQADTASEVQTIVDAYNAILTSADGKAGNTVSALDGLQYAAVGVIVNGTAVSGNTLSLLDSVVDGTAGTAVDTVPELQAFADAASDVVAAAAGGNALTAAELVLLGITGVDGSNLAAVNASIAATADDGSGVSTHDALQSVVSGVIGAHPVISSALRGVTNLEVGSDLVFTANQTVKAGSGSIHIIDKGGLANPLDPKDTTKGYHDDTSTNNQEFTVQEAIANKWLVISGTGTHTTITINPKWDLDLSSNYEISIDDGAFMDESGTNQAVHFNTLSFTTVMPGTHTAGGSVSADAHASQRMTADCGLVAGKSWLDIQGIGNNTGSITQLGDLGGNNAAYALVMKNYADTPAGPGFDGIETGDTFVGVSNFGDNDVLYFDAQSNSTRQSYDPIHTNVVSVAADVGGLTGQNALDIGLTQGQRGSLAVIALGLEGNTANKIFNSVVHVDVDGFAEQFHFTNPPVIMG